MSINPSTSLITSPNNELDIILESITKKAIASLILSSVDPVVSTILRDVQSIVHSRISEYSIELRKKVLSGNEFMSVKLASTISGYHITTIYDWIAKGYIQPFYIEGIMLVSISQIESIRIKKEDVIKSLKKNKRMSKRRYVYSIMSKANFSPILVNKASTSTSS